MLQSKHTEKSMVLFYARTELSKNRNEENILIFGNYKNFLGINLIKIGGRVTR